MTEAERNTITGSSPVIAGFAWTGGGVAIASSSVADQLAALRIAAGEVDALAAVTVAWFDDGDWCDADPLVLERLASLLGLVARGATAVVAAVERFHGVVADSQPTSGSDDWDDEGSARAAPAALAYRTEVVRRLRARCAAAFDLPADQPFFWRHYREGEAPDDALFRIFEAEKRASGLSDEAVLEALAHG